MDHQRLNGSESQGSRADTHDLVYVVRRPAVAAYLEALACFVYPSPGLSLTFCLPFVVRVIVRWLSQKKKSPVSHHVLRAWMASLTRSSSRLAPPLTCVTSIPRCRNPSRRKSTAPPSCLRLSDTDFLAEWIEDRVYTKTMHACDDRQYGPFYARITSSDVEMRSGVGGGTLTMVKAAMGAVIVRAVNFAIAFPMLRFETANVASSRSMHDPFPVPN